MQLPFCKICGERHSLGFCPDFGPIVAPKIVKIPSSRGGVESRHAEVCGREAPELAATAFEPTGIAGVASGPREAIGRRFTPDDMKQEAMPVSKPRFDRNTYQRELMRKRRNAGSDVHAERNPPHRCSGNPLGKEQDETSDH